MSLVAVKMLMPLEAGRLVEPPAWFLKDSRRFLALDTSRTDMLCMCSYELWRKKKGRGRERRREGERGKELKGGGVEFDFCWKRVRVAESSLCCCCSRILDVGKIICCEVESTHKNTQITQIRVSSTMITMVSREVKREKVVRVSKRERLVRREKGERKERRRWLLVSYLGGDICWAKH